MATLSRRALLEVSRWFGGGLARWRVGARPPGGRCAPPAPKGNATAPVAFPLRGVVKATSANYTAQSAQPPHEALWSRRVRGQSCGQSANQPATVRTVRSPESLDGGLVSACPRPHTPRVLSYVDLRLCLKPPRRRGAVMSAPYCELSSSSYDRPVELVALL